MNMMYPTIHFLTKNTMCNDRHVGFDLRVLFSESFFCRNVYLYENTTKTKRLF